MFCFSSEKTNISHFSISMKYAKIRENMCLKKAVCQKNNQQTGCLNSLKQLFINPTPLNPKQTAV